MLRPETKFSLARQFQADLSLRKWQIRQCGVLTSRPLETQQDFFLFHLLNTLGNASLREKLSLNQPPTLADSLLSPIFPELPDVCADAFKALLRTLVGLEDFARSNVDMAV